MAPTAEKQYFVSKGKLVIYWLMFTFWLLGFYPFVVQLSSYKLFEVIDGRVMLFFEVAYILLGLLLLRRRSDIWITVSFMVLAFISTVIVNGRPPLDWFNGLRFYVPLFAMLPIIRFVMATRERREFFIELFDRSLYIFLWVQVPCMIYQFVVWGGWDYGGGSLGFWQSGVISELIYTVSFYLMLRRWDHERGYLTNLSMNWVLVFLLFPSFLNETKSSFIFLVLYFFFLAPLNRKFWKSMLVMVPFMVGAIWLFNYFYMDVYGKSEYGDVLSKEYFDFYVIGDPVTYDLMEMAYDKSEADDDVDFQRGLKWVAIPWVMDDQGDQSWIWGNGIGLVKGRSEDNPTEINRDYRWLLQGTMMTMEMLILECGIWGVLWFVAAMTVLFRREDRRDRISRGLRFFQLGMLVSVIFYNTSMNIIFFCLIYYTLTFLSTRWNYALELGNINPRGFWLTLGGVFTNVRLPRAEGPALSADTINNDYQKR